MAPEYPVIDAQSGATDAIAMENQHRASLETRQPDVSQAMDPQRPHQDAEVNLRGGDERSSMCPGRFCFIIPCPIPCDCCIIPCFF